VRGEILELKETINRIVDKLNALAWEVTRVAREVGTEAKLAVCADAKMKLENRPSVMNQGGA